MPIEEGQKEQQGKHGEMAERESIYGNNEEAWSRLGSSDKPSKSRINRLRVWRV
jgi:hypothetical protein